MKNPDDKPKKPRRKQQEIPGFERQVERPDIEAAAQAYCEIRDERSALSKREKQAQMNLLAIMRAQKVPRYEYHDENGEVLEAVIVLGEEKAVVRKTGDAESEVGQGVDEPDAPPIPGGLLAQARQAQADAGVAETTDGDVVPLEQSAPKKRGRKGKAK